MALSNHTEEIDLHSEKEKQNPSLISITMQQN